MVSEFLVYFQIGLSHIADIRGYDHIVFVVALTAGYPAREWRPLLWLVTAFTLGHSLTLALATLGVVTVSSAAIELLIAITIVATALFALLQLRTTERTEAGSRQRILYAMAGTFGLIHGLGFSGYLRSILGGGEGLLWPLLSFNVGLEVGQLGIVAATLTLGAILCEGAGLSRRRWSMGLSVLALLVGARMVMERMA